MKILGARALNANNYSKISLYKNINVLGPSYKGKLKVSDEFTKSLKGKTDKEKRDEVTRYFLRNHYISMLFQDCEDIGICSKDGVELFISRSQELSKEVLNEAISKYEYDRMKAYAESDVDFYWMMTDYGFDTVGMGYHVGQVDDFKRELEGLPEILSNKKCMVLDIGVRKKYEDRELKLFEINPIEKKFFARMLEDIEEASFYCYSNDLFKNKAIYKCRINGKEVFLVIPRELAEFSYDLDEKISSEVEEKVNCMLLQYKMEGF